MPGLVVVGALLILAGLLFKIGAAPFHSWTPTSTRGTDADHGLHGRVHQGGGVRRAPARAVRREPRPRAVVAGHARGPVRRAVDRHAAHHGRRDRRRCRADRRQAAPRLLVDRPRGLHPRRRPRLLPALAAGDGVLPPRLRPRDGRRLRGRHARPRDGPRARAGGRDRRGGRRGADGSDAADNVTDGSSREPVAVLGEATHLAQWAGLGAAARGSPASSRSSCSPWRASR